MCGIAGYLFKDGARLSDNHWAGLTEGAIRAMQHRGPNGNGVHKEESALLVHTRLSILDVEHGDQPLHSHCGRYVLIGNGEIYNYKELQHELSQKGIACKTGSDCEPVVHLFAELGPDIFHKLRGMYALAIYDKEERSLTLARDTFGIKPLYIAETGLGVGFASEPNVFLASGWVKRQLNESKLPEALVQNWTGGTETLFKGIKRLAPGEVLRLQDGKVVESFIIASLGNENYDATLDEALDAFDAKFMDSVEKHMQSDVPFGVYLSGGVDSSAVTTAMAEHEKQVSSFSIGFESEDVPDETGLAEEVAGALGANHQNINFSEEDFWKYLPVMVEHMDDWCADYAILPVLKLSEFASQHVTVVLSGEGGDEFFAGYSRYRKPVWKTLFKKEKNDSQRFSNLFKQDIELHKNPPPVELDKLQKKQWQDIQGWLPHDLLLKLDRSLMAYGLEGRVPFVDKHVSNFGLSLPSHLKMKGKTGKYLVKMWLSHVVAGWFSKGGYLTFKESLFAKKRGFSVPIASWLSNRAEDLLAYFESSTWLDDSIERAELQKWLKAGKLNQKQALVVFRLLSLCLWYDVHIAGTGYPEILKKKG
jgi:asparagine synthase (glutamine-hydrolysing)